MQEFFDGLARNLRSAVLVDDRWKMYLRGLGTTLEISLVAVLLGVVLGMLIAMTKISAQGAKKPPRGAPVLYYVRYALARFVFAVCNVYTTVIRGTPLMLQLMILYFFSFMPNGLVAAMIGFGLNSGAYVSETFRSGIQSVDIGQTEAARSLGLTRWQAMRSVVLPQAVKNVLPAIFNEFIALVKETSIAGYIAVNDLTKVVNQIRSRSFNSTSLYLAALIYLFLTFLLTLALGAIERRLAKSDRR
ncbi:MAG: amino acid ABC transporter permease [Oscillospiraceae bacterium]|jgi:His/Glu/Gln/Arg/opine family amino acid ABC transporter permease subunit|nr:amino acid ABC transporter permease [Oscillospiraceae bacterium]